MKALLEKVAAAEVQNGGANSLYRLHPAGLTCMGIDPQRSVIDAADSADFD